VRSSSTAEDTATASFAGQYRTVLDVGDVDAVLGAVEACRASESHALAYAAALGAGPGRMAVLVQRFVEPLFAGVAFTRDPRAPHLSLIESHAGRGEALVSGRVTPDRYVLDRESGTVQDAPASDRLSRDALASVAALARQAETLLGGAQDVEWAVAADGAVLLQARPITVDDGPVLHPRARRLTRANVGEVLPDA